MTTRLYYTDAYLRSFEATVQTSDVAGADVHVVLDRTAFYPSSGGQLFDTGTLGGAVVRDVLDRDDGEVVHVVSSPIAPGTAVVGTIDWPRRFDHIQQHSGQHLLSAAFEHLFGVPTVSVHLGSETATIDLARDVTTAEIQRAEEDANRVVWEDRPVDVRFVTLEEAAALPLRKATLREGTIRIVEIAEYDLSACGGTHVSRTGSVGMIAVVASERFKPGTRVTFVCGARALRSHMALRDVVGAAARLLSVAPPDLAGRIERTQIDLKDAAAAVERLEAALATHRAHELQNAAEEIAGRRVVISIERARSGQALRDLAMKVVAAAGLLAVLIGEGDPAPVVVTRSPDLEIDAGALVRAITSALGGRGGGRAELAQAGVTAAPARIAEFVRGQLGGMLKLWHFCGGARAENS